MGTGLLKFEYGAYTVTEAFPLEMRGTLQSIIGRRERANRRCIEGWHCAATWKREGTQWVGRLWMQLDG